MVGPGKPVQDRFFVVASTISAAASARLVPLDWSGYASPLGADFPIVTVEDRVDAQVRLADRLRSDASPR
jgi:homoserine O-acetyltransferase